MTTDKKQEILINIIFIVVIAALAFVALKYLFPYIAPFVIAFIVAFALRRPTDWLAAKTRMMRWVWAVALVVLTFCAALFLISFGLYKSYTQLVDLIRLLPQYAAQITAFFAQVNSMFSNLLNLLPPEISSAISLFPETMMTSLTGVLTDWLSRTTAAVAGGLPGILLSFAITVIASCFISKDYYKIIAFIKSKLSDKHAALVSEIRSVLTSNVLKMLRGYLILMLITFGELLAGLWILRYKNAFGLALIIAIVDILPVLGTGTVLIPWSLILIISGSPSNGIAILILYAIITVIRNILEPKIIGSQVGLHPLVMLISIYIGLRLFGLVGLIGIPMLMVCLKSLIKSGQLHITKRTNK